MALDVYSTTHHSAVLFMGPDAEACGFVSPPTLNKLSWASFIWLALESEPRVLLSLKGGLWAEKMSLAAGYGASFSREW